MILVSGATGTVGKEVVKNLTALKAPFKVLTRDPKKAAAALGKVDVVTGDFADAASLEKALAGIDTFFLLANGSPQQEALEKGAVAAAKKAGVKRVVYLSVVGASKDSPIALARWHAAVEESLKSSGLAWTILQPHNFMQNLLANVATIADGKLYAPAEDSKFATVDARDIGAVAAHALAENGHEGKTYVITGGESVSHTQIAKAIGEAIGKKVDYVNITPDAFGAALKGAGLPDWLIADYQGLFAFFRTGGGAFTTDTVEKVGRKKPFTVQDFARDYAGAFGKTPAAALR